MRSVRRAERIEMIMVPTHTTTTMTNPQPYVIPSNAANRGRSDFHDVYDISMDNSEAILRDELREESERRERQEREAREQRDIRLREAKERRERLNRMRNKHRVKESLRRGSRDGGGGGEPNSNSCSICLEVVEMKGDNRMLECGHVFHSSCVNQWLNNK
eukprot:CAMPEP_0118654630 /NCGR_PEP_ID=MMETSP0785-20121206/12496_1 /TAXON_ID=91992 /ORGANISM="Bolidomonas pacifica, Strain CCMP 1866" /LENGTH=159 /DNA_ID=CAMNT_0006547311 /DNA_START=439 /DNA_END=915 /DNA_ORIENTATION=-